MWGICPRPQKKVVAELGPEPVFPEFWLGPCSAESAAPSHPKARPSSGPPASRLPGGGVGSGQSSQRTEHLEAWERNQLWDSQDSAGVPGDLRHDSPRPRVLDGFAVFLGKSVTFLRGDCKCTFSGSEGEG